MNLKCVISVLIIQLFFGQLVLSQTDGVVANKAVGGKRLALVIGNGAYQKTSELPNPTNDATDMAATLSSLGFEVISGTNQNKRQMEVMIREFGDKLARQGGVGLFFYAGHGLQVKGSNYLVPVDAEIPAEDEVEYSTVNLNFLLNKMDAAKNDLNIVILDACRNNPFARSWRNFRDFGEGGGLAKITPPTGTLMLYATQPGNVASDGTGRNGLFTESLLEQIRRPNLELDSMIKQLARDVSERSGKKQMPWKEGIVTGDFYFAGGTSDGGGTQPVITQPVVSGVNAEDVMWQEVARINTKLAVEGYLSEYPNGRYVATAKLKLRLIDAEEDKRAKELEIERWKEVERNNTIDEYQSYLDEYSAGEFRDKANNRLVELRAKLKAERSPQKGRSIKTSAGMDFVGVPAGSFLMGSPKNEDNRGKDENQRQVTISKSFWIGKYEVTQSQWRAVMGSVPDSCFEKNDVRGDSRPVVCVNWEDVQVFIQKLNAMGEEKYRLPTEAEWEYAARAESTTPFFFGNDENQICEYGNGKDPFADVWMGKKMCKDGIKGTTVVGKFKANDFGIHDTAGNVSEWVNDWYSDYSKTGETDPVGPSSGTGRVHRGGNGFDSRKSARTAFRSFAVSSTRDYRIGFRLVMEN